MPAIHFRHLNRADFLRLSIWLAQPHVARWWNHDTRPAALEVDFGASIVGRDPADVFIVSAEGRPLGLLQRYTFGDNPGYMQELEGLVVAPPEALSIDYFVGEPQALRRGFGTVMIRAAVTAIWRDHPVAPSVIVPVNQANIASRRVLERAGFTVAAAGLLEPDNPLDSADHIVYSIERPG